MNLTIRQLRYVHEVARFGSILSASKSLRISQSSILAAISLAEDEIGAKIFDRKPARGVRITPAGERFVGAARMMLSAETEFDRSVGDLTGRIPKLLRVACFEPFGALFMPEMLRAYIEEVGAVDIDLHEGDQLQIKDWLQSGKVDVAVLYDIGPNIVGSITDICKVPAHALISADDPLSAKDALWLSELATRPLVLLDLPQTSTYLLTLFDILAQRPDVKFHTRSYETVRAAVSSGLGVSILNMRPIGRATADGQGIVRRPILDDLPAPKLIVSDMYGDAKPLFLRLFIDVLRRFFFEIGPRGFAVTTPDRESSLLL